MAKGKSASPRTSLQQDHPRSEQAEPTASILTPSDEPEVVVDELDGVLHLPEDGDEGKELHDAAEAQRAVLAATQKMRADFGIAPSVEQLREAQDLFPKVEQICSYLHTL